MYNMIKQVIKIVIYVTEREFIKEISIPKDTSCCHVITLETLSFKIAMQK